MIRKLFVSLATLFVFLFTAHASFASTLHLSPGSAKVGTGIVTSIQVRLNTGGESVNAVSAYLSYPADKLEVAWVTYGSSFSIAAEGSYGGGAVRISRGNITGVSGNLLVATIGFRGKSQGTAPVSFIGGSAAPRASDSSESLNLGGSAGATFTVVQGSTSTKTADSKTPQTEKDDTTKPIISAIKAEKVTKTGATITWKTNENADSMVEFGLDKGKYLLNTTNATPKTNHSLELKSDLLVPGNLLHYRIISKDSAGNATTSEDQTVQLLGYTVSVKVIDQNNKPLGNAKVILYSDPMDATTTEGGIATFKNVTPGKHVVIVKLANNTEKSQEIVVKEVNSTQNFETKVQASSSISSTMLMVFAVAIILVIIGTILMIKQKKQPQQPVTNSTVSS